jgi:hypothetical protein
LKLIHVAPVPCPCYIKLEAFDKQYADRPLGVGSVVECDCGQRYTLTDSQREGPAWVKQVIPLRDKITMTTMRD